MIAWRMVAVALLTVLILSSAWVILAEADVTPGCFSNTTATFGLGWTSFSCTSPGSGPNPIPACTPDIKAAGCGCFGNPGCNCLPSLGAVPCPLTYNPGALPVIGAVYKNFLRNVNSQYLLPATNQISGAIGANPPPGVRLVLITLRTMLVGMQVTIARIVTDPPDFHWQTGAPYVVTVAPTIAPVAGFLTATEATEMTNYIQAMYYTLAELNAALASWERAQGALLLCHRVEADGHGWYTDRYLGGAREWGELSKTLINAVNVQYSWGPPDAIIATKGAVQKLRTINWSGLPALDAADQPTTLVNYVAVHAAPLQNCP